MFLVLSPFSFCRCFDLLIAFPVAHFPSTQMHLLHPFTPRQPPAINLTNSPMHPLPHRSLRLMPLPMLQPPRLVHLLNTPSCAWLESGDIDGIGLHELFGDGDDVCDEPVEEVEGHAFADDDAEDFGGVGGGGEGIVLFLVERVSLEGLVC